MTYKEIVDEIEKGLTGDNEKDCKYLYDLMAEYKDHEMGKEIVKELSRMLFERLPEEAKNEINNTINNELPFRKLINEFDALYAERKPELALEKIKEAVTIFEEIGYFEEDEVSIYKDFNELFEALIYSVLYKPTKELRNTGNIPVAEMYAKYGACLFELKRFREAADALNKSIEWNPISNLARFELAEVYKVLGNFDKFLDEVKVCYRHAFTKNDIAHAYRMLAFYFAEKETFEEANVFISSSLLYDPTNNMGISEAEYIRYHLKDKLPLDDKFIKSVSEKYNITLQANPELLAIADGNKKYAEENGHKEYAEYFKNIINEMNNDSRKHPYIVDETKNN